MNPSQNHAAYICLGSNLGDRRQYLYSAIEALDRHPNVTVERCSSIYETEPVGLKEQPHYLNMAAHIRTSLPPNELLRLMLDTERSLGRVRDVRWGPRTIDLDLLLYDNVTLRTEELELPHPRMLERAFVLLPLLEVLNTDNPYSNIIWQAAAATEGKEEVALWAKTNWRSEFGHFAN